MHTRIDLASASAAITLALAATASAGVIPAAYSQDFDDDTAGLLTVTNQLTAGNPPAVAATQTISGGTYNFSRLSSAASGVSDANVWTAASGQVVGAGGFGFQVSIDVDPNANFGADQISVVARSSAENLGGSSFNGSSGYALTLGNFFSSTWNIRIYEGSTTISSIVNVPSSPASGGFYTLTLTGTPQGNGDLLLAGTISNGSNSAYVDVTDATPTVGGEYFGFKSGRTFGNNGYSQQFDNFDVTVAVPEPASLAMVALAVPLILSRRRQA